MGRVTWRGEDRQRSAAVLISFVMVVLASPTGDDVPHTRAVMSAAAEGARLATTANVRRGGVFVDSCADGAQGRAGRCLLPSREADRNVSVEQDGNRVRVLRLWGYARPSPLMGRSWAGTDGWRGRLYRPRRGASRAERVGGDYGD